LAGSTSKRVVIYRFERQLVEGIVSPGAYLLEAGIEIVSLAGALLVFPYEEVKGLCFVNEFGDPRLFSHNNQFERRPRVPGLWTRFTLLDGDTLDGILPHNLLEWPSQGYSITPPHATGLRQRVFIPRVAVKSTELRGVVGMSLAGAAQRRLSRSTTEAQLNMFRD
jgi:hypothetical protein